VRAAGVRELMFPEYEIYFSFFSVWEEGERGSGGNVFCIEVFRRKEAEEADWDLIHFHMTQLPEVLLPFPSTNTPPFILEQSIVGS